MLDTDARRRITANDLVSEPYIACSDIRLTAFETAGSIFRSVQNDHIKKHGQRSAPLRLDSFKREAIKDAHVTTIEHLVSLNI